MNRKKTFLVHDCCQYTACPRNVLQYPLSLTGLVMRPQDDLEKSRDDSEIDATKMKMKGFTSSSGRSYNKGITSGPISRKTTTLIFWSVLLTWDAMDVSRLLAVRDSTDGDNPGDDIVV